MRRELLGGAYIQIVETPVDCQVRSRSILRERMAAWLKRIQATVAAARAHLTSQQLIIDPKLATGRVPRCFCS
jgi:hypothetical protein